MATTTTSNETANDTTVISFVRLARRCTPHLGCLAVLAVAAVATAAAAQTEPGSYGEPPGPFHQPVAPYPVEMGFSQHHSSTFAEGWSRGRAALVQAEGNFRLSQAQAGVINEQGRWINRINDLEQTRALYAQQELWRENRDREQLLRDERSANGAAKLALRERTLYHSVYQLSAGQLDRESGVINWPELLLAEECIEYRERLDELFREQLAYGAATESTAQEIARCTKQFQRALQNDCDSLPRDAYSAAQRFLLGLKYEALHQVVMS
jgi:hypothetical protein